MNLIQEYRAERTRSEFHIAKYFTEKKLDRNTMLLSSELRNRWTDFKHAASNRYQYWQGTLFPSRYTRLVETTKPADIFRTWESA